MIIIDLIVTIALVGLLVYLITLIPMPDAFQQAIRILGIIFVVLVLLQAIFGMHIIPIAPLPIFHR